MNKLLLRLISFRIFFLAQGRGFFSLVFSSYPFWLTLTDPLSGFNFHHHASRTHWHGVIFSSDRFTWQVNGLGPKRQESVLVVRLVLAVILVSAIILWLVLVHTFVCWIFMLMGHSMALLTCHLWVFTVVSLSTELSLACLSFPYSQWVPPYFFDLRSHHSFPLKSQQFLFIFCSPSFS